MANYPNTLPAPFRDGFSGAPDKAFIRTNMEAGSVRQRKIFTASNEMMSIKWRFNAEQFAAFKDFFKTTINQGADWFVMNINIGNGSADYNCRFTDPYQYDLIARDFWEVTAKIEVRNA